MKKTASILGYVLLGTALLVASVLLYVSFALPDTGPAPDLKVDVTPERVARGEYLANHVMVCMDCHSKRDFGKFAGPPVPGTLGQGGEKFSEDFGFPGNFYSPNLTPHALGTWTDGEIYRAITTGVNKEGKALFPVMPYLHYGAMDPEDVKDIIAYLRSIPPIAHEVPESKANFPFNFIINTLPSKGNPVKRPEPRDTVAYGKYLTYSAGCYECHSPADDKGKKLPGMDFAGGWEMKLGGGHSVTTANITPDHNTGIGKWSEEAFIARFKAYGDSSYSSPPVKPGAFQTVMPWKMYGGMKTEDLRAIYRYLMTVTPVTNKVTVFR